ncbi:uncharacterized protein LOC116955684 isoform X4 [Petromyzon marinus]|uniref:uncharacterized protein LOC116955684 isoform X4 n=1 Tax=Petromyzon marinus TaxID=7757 RepID=UPI003F70B696
MGDLKRWSQRWPPWAWRRRQPRTERRPRLARSCWRSWWWTRTGSGWCSGTSSSRPSTSHTYARMRWSTPTPLTSERCRCLRRSNAGRGSCERCPGGSTSWTRMPSSTTGAWASVSAGCCRRVAAPGRTSSISHCPVRGSFATSSRTRNIQVNLDIRDEPAAAAAQPSLTTPARATHTVAVVVDETPPMAAAAGVSTGVYGDGVHRTCYECGRRGLLARDCWRRRGGPLWAPNYYSGRFPQDQGSRDRPFWEGLPTGRRLKGHRSGPMAVPTVNDGQPRQLSVAGTGMGAGFVGKTSEALCIKIEHYSLAGAVTAGTVDAILPVLAAAGGGGGDGGGDGGPIVDYFQVTLKGGSTVRAHHVVLAAGPTRAAMAVVPDWVSSIGERFPEDRLLHTTEFISRAGGSVANVVSEPDEHVLVVGGGLSSAHMVLLAVEAGASSVTWVMRKHLQVKQFDVGDVETLVGRYAHREHGVRLDGLPFLRQFYAERGPRRRLDMIRQARKGGAVTPEAYGQIRPLIEAGIVSLRAYCQVESASWSYKEQRWRVVLSTGKETWSGDRIWLATGCKLDVAQDPLLANVLRHFPVPLVEGWPAIDDDLRWATGCELYLMGQYAALKVTNLCNWMAQVWTSIKVGPHAVNLAGGQAASARIAKAILQKHREEQQEDSSSRAQEFIDHMHGLMWC